MTTWKRENKSVCLRDRKGERDDFVYDDVKTSNTLTMSKLSTIDFSQILLVLTNMRDVVFFFFQLAGFVFRWPRLHWWHNFDEVKVRLVNASIFRCWWESEVFRWRCRVQLLSRICKDLVLTDDHVGLKLLGIIKYK